MCVTFMQKHASDELIKVLLLMFEKLYIEQKFIHFSRMLKKPDICSRCERNVLDYEYDKTCSNQKRSYRWKLEVWAYSIFD